MSLILAIPATVASVALPVVKKKSPKAAEFIKTGLIGYSEGMLSLKTGLSLQQTNEYFSCMKLLTKETMNYLCNKFSQKLMLKIH